MRPLKGAAPTGDPAFAALKSRLVARTGHHYYADKDDLLWERVGRRMRARGVPDPAGYLALLEESEAEWAALESEITIGETFFFRYAEQFAALRGTILPERIAARSDERRLRIWSAGCSTGPETYSVGIVLHELLGDRLPDWRIGLTGTDINRDVLAVARRAVYGSWALRTLGAEERERYFRPGPREGTFALRSEFRGLARFEPQNLMSLLDGTASLALTDYDLILCRNVLIYFHPDVVQALVRAWRSACGPGAGCCWDMPSRTRPSRNSWNPSPCRAPPPIAARTTARCRNRFRSCRPCPSRSPKRPGCRSCRRSCRPRNRRPGSCRQGPRPLRSRFRRGPSPRSGRSPMRAISTRAGRPAGRRCCKTRPIHACATTKACWPAPAPGRRRRNAPFAARSTSIKASSWRITTSG